MDVVVEVAFPSFRLKNYGIWVSSLPTYTHSRRLHGQSGGRSPAAQLPSFCSAGRFSDGPSQLDLEASGLVGDNEPRRGERLWCII